MPVERKQKREKTGLLEEIKPVIRKIPPSSLLFIAFIHSEDVSFYQE